jgi:excinuclease ABC subunit C
LQNEVHRYAIAFHRDKRSKSQIESIFDKIKGIGENAKTKLLNHFKSVKRLQDADFIEIENIVGTKKAEIITEFFKNYESIEPKR